MVIKAEARRAGYAPIVERTGPDADMLMDFGTLELEPGAAWSTGRADEKALLLLSGEAELSWDGGRAAVSRGSLLDEPPTVLRLPEGAEAQVAAGHGGASFLLTRTANPRRFEPRLYLPADCGSELRGRGTMRETSTRIVRTVFDDANAPDSMLVLGEVVAAPGKWSSYPPHHHPQPEIYHYRFSPEGGFGLALLGDEAELTRHGDTLLIREGQVHPQAAAPGYAMWYLWVIRHLEGARYRSPVFLSEHAWVMEPGAEIWEPSEAAGPRGGMS